MDLTLPSNMEVDIIDETCFSRGSTSMIVGGRVDIYPHDMEHGPDHLLFPGAPCMPVHLGHVGHIYPTLHPVCPMRMRFFWASARSRRSFGRRGPVRASASPLVAPPSGHPDRWAPPGFVLVCRQPMTSLYGSVLAMSVGPSPNPMPRVSE